MKWETVHIGDVCNVIAGGTPQRSKPDFWGGKIPWVKISDMLQGTINSTDECITDKGLQESTAKLLPAGTILISIFATIGRTATLGIAATTNQAIVGVVPKKPGAFHLPFLRYCLENLADHLKSLSRGVAQANINGSVLKQAQIPLPPLAEQKRIAGILDAADALRAKRREALAQLDSLLQATFLDLFGDPVTNPKGWKTTELGDLVETDDTINYGVVQPGDDHPNGRPLIRVGDLDGGELNTAGVKLIDPTIERQYERSRLNGRELLVSCVGSIGIICKVPLSAKTLFQKWLTEQCVRCKQIKAAARS